MGVSLTRPTLNGDCRIVLLTCLCDLSLHAYNRPYTQGTSGFNSLWWLLLLEDLKRVQTRKKRKKERKKEEEEEESPTPSIKSLLGASINSSRNPTPFLAISFPPTHSPSPWPPLPAPSSKAKRKEAELSKIWSWWGPLLLRWLHRLDTCFAVADWLVSDHRYKMATERVSTRYIYIIMGWWLGRQYVQRTSGWQKKEEEKKKKKQKNKQTNKQKETKQTYKAPALLIWLLYTYGWSDNHH